MMQRYRYTLTANSAVSVGILDDRANTRRAHQIIPGATLRGALAARWWQGRPPEDPAQATEFDDIFESKLIVGQAVPTDMELVSASAKVCKYPQKPACRTVAIDSATDPAGDKCPYCSGVLTGAPGWRRIPNEQNGTMLVSRTRGQLDDRETAATGQLFTRQAIKASEHGKSALFTGVLHAEPEFAEWLRGATLRVGGGRSIGLGEVGIQVTDDPWPELPTGEQLVLRLTSPTILLDAFGGPDVSLDALAAELRRVADIESLTVHAEPAWLRTELVGGWHMRSRLPKALDWALAPGSVIGVRGLTPAGWGRLARGIGYRSLEGYGQLECLNASPSSTADEPTRQPDRITRQPVQDAAGSDPVGPVPDSDNEGIKKLKAFRGRINNKKAWLAVRDELLAALRKIQQAPSADRERIRSSARFDRLLGGDQAAARSVLGIPAGHVPGTIARLERMK